MNKTLATAVPIIIEAAIEELAERIKQRKKRYGHTNELNCLRFSGGVYGLRGRSAAHTLPYEDDKRQNQSITCRRRQAEVDP